MTRTKLEKTLVLGGGPSSLRAAAAVAARGQVPLVLEPSPWAGALSDPSLPVENDLSRPRAPLGADFAALAGPFEPVPGPARAALLVGGRLLSFPPRPREVLGLLGREGSTRQGLHALLARVAWRQGDNLGLWTEVRTLGDRLERDHGKPLTDELLRDFARRRWGDPDQLAAAHVLGFEATGRADPVAPAEEPARRHHALLQRILDAGGEIRTGTDVEGILPEREGSLRVALRRGGLRYEIRTASPIWVTAPPARVAAWLGDSLPPSLGIDAGKLRTRHALRLLVEVQGCEPLPLETLLLDARGPFFRVVNPARSPGCATQTGRLALHANLDASDPHWDLDDAALLEIARASLALLPWELRVTGLSCVARLRDYEPIRDPAWHPRWLRLLDAFERFGLRPVGRAGAFAPLDELAEWALLEACLAPTPTSLREIHRLHADPEVPRRI